MSKAVTIKDIARTLGLSVSTVGRALADSTQISEETKARVRQAALKQGYVAHSGARAMRSGRSTLIGLLVPDIQNDFYGTVAQALAACCAAAGYQLVLAVTDENPDVELSHVRSLMEARVAGVVIVGSVAPRPETLTLLARIHTVQLIRRIAGLDSAWFGMDDAGCLEVPTAALIALGHRRIAYVGGAKELSTGDRRLGGYQAAFARAGLDIPHDLIRLGQPRAAAAAQMFADLWSHREARPTAVVTGGARLTVGVLESIADLGLQVPDELSVIGFGDAPWLKWWGTAGLSTVALPVRDIAASCGEYLMRRIAENGGARSADAAPFHAMHAPHLVARSSTAPPPHRD